MTASNKCLNCKYTMTWAHQRVQFGRALRAGMSPDEAKHAMPRCQKCMTSLLRTRHSNTAKV